MEPCKPELFRVLYVLISYPQVPPYGIGFSENHAAVEGARPDRGVQRLSSEAGRQYSVPNAVLISKV